MKTLKYLTVCIVVCCLFAGNASAACSAGITVDIVGTFQSSGLEADFGVEGDVIEYTVSISIDSGQCSVTNAEPELILPDGTPIDLGDALTLAPGEATDLGTYVYVLSGDDIGTNPTPLPSAVRAIATVEAISNRESGILQPVTATANYDTLVLDPCVEVEKTASCDIAKEGDDYIYTITITNCGGDDLTAVSIEDSMFGSLLPECEVLPVDGVCVIEIPYTVQPDDPDLLENTVTVVYAVTTLPAVTVTDTDDASVEVIHPDFTVTKECLTDGVVAEEVTFEIVITNTGDVPLDIETNEPEIAPFSLDPGDPPSVHQIIRPVPVDAEEVENTVEVTASIRDVCADNPATIVKTASDTCTVLEADFTVTKECTTPEVPVGENATFHITITNTGDVPLSFETNEPELWPLEPIIVSAGGVFEADVDRLTMSGMDIISNTIEVTGTYEDITITKSDSADCDVIEGTEGCTPGFWKNHPACWRCYDEETLVSEVFTVLSDPNHMYADYKDGKCDFDADTLKESIRYRGGTGVAGAARNLLRHASAALQNACSQDVQYPLSVNGVIDMVNDALASEKAGTINGAKNLLAMFNEYGCPINAHCELNGTEEPEPEPVE